MKIKILEKVCSLFYPCDHAHTIHSFQIFSHQKQMKLSSSSKKKFGRCDVVTHGLTDSPKPTKYHHLSSRPMKSPSGIRQIGSSSRMSTLMLDWIQELLWSGPMVPENRLCEREHCISMFYANPKFIGSRF